MALPSRCALPFLVISFFSFISTVMGGGQVGVNYGRDANNLMPPDQVAKLLKDNSIGAVNIYDADPTVLRALSGTGIKVAVALPNGLLSQAAGSAASAADWVRNNVAAYGSQIQAIAVGNEVFHCCAGLTPYLFPAMRNIADAVAGQGLGSAVKVSTPVSFDAVTNSFPPSDGTFRENLQPVMRDILGLLRRTGSYLMINIYTYQAYINDTKNIPLDYALGRAQTPVLDSKTGRSYYSLLDAQLDAVYSAMGRLQDRAQLDASSTPSLMVSLTLKETGWPHLKPMPPPLSMRTTAGEPTRKVWPSRKKAAYDGNLNASLADGSDAATVENAQKYNANLIQRILAGSTGTPLYPDANMDVYIFSLFDENQKTGDPTENYYGLFSPNGQKNYDFSFQPTGYTPTPVGPTWCEANEAAGRDRLQEALDWACGQGKADCGPIQPGAPCFEPNTVGAHATYAFNSYYQKQGRNPSACDFKGAARIVGQAPGLLSRDCTKVTWCSANSQVGRDRLQAALDWACGKETGQGNADCGPIQPGAACYEPNTLESHATYAFNSYYQKQYRMPGACDFQGAAFIVSQRPRIGNCWLPP